MVFQNHGAQNGRKREGDHPRQHNGTGHGNGKLAVKNTHRPRHKCDGHKYCGHNQGNRDDGATDFVQYLFHGFERREVFGFHFDVHRFHDHNCIVHHNTDGQNQGKQRNQIDR